MLKRLLHYRREVRERVEREATNLLTFLGEGAYDEARVRSRDSRAMGDRSEARIWSAVAVEIANQTGYRIGEKVADRYQAALPPRSAAEREIASGLVDIAQGIADLAKGKGDATSLHNLRARVLQLVDRAGQSPDARHAAAELCSAADSLAASEGENRAALAAGAYPHPAVAAGQALRRLRASIMPKAKDFI